MPHSSHPSDAPAPGAILDWLTEALFVVDHDFRCVYVNDSAGRRPGTSRDELLHRDLRELTEDLDNQPVYAACRRAIREQVPRVLSHALSTVVWRTDGRGRPTHVLDWTTLAGHIVRPGEEPVWEEVVHPDDRSPLADAWRRSLTTGTELDFTYRLRHADGRWLRLRTHGVPVREDGEILEWIGVVYDLSDQAAAEDALRRAALEDPLTGLPNRTLFLERLRDVLLRRDHRAAVLYVDIDGFKSVNDRFGHAVGDALLRDVAVRLGDVVRPSDVVSRLSGDEFAVICDGLDTPEEATTIALRVCRALASPLATDERVHVSASVGVTLLGAADDDPEAVLKAADAAMYQAKGRGGAVEIFDETLRTRLHQRTVIESELRSGLTGGGLNLHFQPVVALDGERPWVEALLRWQRPGGPAIPAPDAISVAEATGLIAPIGRAVLALACAECARWELDAGVAVNVSARQLARPDELVADVQAALRASGLPPERLALEITETVLMDDMLQGETVMRRLQALGVTLEIDDFGVGYSSLSYLHRLPVQALKLDRSFISGLPDDAASARILEAVVGLAAAFDVRLIAEGVETEAQLAAVRAAGAHAVQGYGLARPAPSAELPERLRHAVAVAARA